MFSLFNRLQRYCAVCLLVLIPALIYSDHNQAAEHKLLILGDSLSAAYGLKQEQGWVSLLQNAWQQQQIQVINAAVSGETTDGGLARLPRLLSQHSPSHLLIELGGNDGLQGHPVSKIRGNIQQMIDLAKQQDIQVMLQQMRIPTNFGRRYNDMFTESFALLAEHNNIPLVPFFLEELALKDDYMQRDGIHPNAEAQPIIAEIMQQQLEPLILERQAQ